MRARQTLVVVVALSRCSPALSWAHYYTERCESPLLVDEDIMGAAAELDPTGRDLVIDGEPCSGGPQPLRRARGSTVLVALSDPPEGTRYSEHVIDAGDGAAHFSDADAACGRRRVTGRWMKSAPTPSKLTLPRGEDIATTVLTWAWAPRYGPVFVGSCEVTLADEAEEL